MRKHVVIVGVLLSTMILFLFVEHKRKMETLKKAKAISVISEKKGERDDKLSNRFHMDIYHLKDDSIIAVEAGYYVLFKNVDELEKFLSQHKSSVEILFGKNPFNERFPEQTKFLIEELFNALNLDQTNNLDYGLIKKIDALIVKNGKQFMDKYFLNILALLGETIIVEKQAKWRMVLAKDNLTWYPQLEYKGQEIALAVYLFEDLFEKPGFPSPVLFTYQSMCDIIEHNLR